MGVDHDGGYAELVTTPEQNLFVLDDRVSFEQAAAARRSCGRTPVETVLFIVRPNPPLRRSALRQRR